MRFFGFVFVVVSCCLLYCFSFVFAGGLLLLCHVVHDHVDDIILYDILYDLVFFCFFFSHMMLFLVAFCCSFLLVCDFAVKFACAWWTL